ncbi:uncharacterized protein LOC121786394 [Salvia splendens]|uniref:uncharacterized protein LOC121786394 n=1 Tax=Salvia splendens TaxID=180675 RepID=UPI0011037CBD|nr:uncharacterized protein LOC121786394 [Salvia splendens]
MQKFKFLATQCAVTGSPTRSPTTSPVIHLRRRTTLRMLLTRSGNGPAGRRRLPPRFDRKIEERSPEKASVAVSHKLKDLFVSSPPSFSERASESVGERLMPGGGGRRGGGARALSVTFRQRLLRRAWRPALVAIPE